MAKLDELWDPVPRRLIADMRSEKWTTQRPAPDVVGWLWAFRQIGDGAVPSIRDLCAYTGWGSHRATRLLNEVVQASNAWTGGEVERQAPHNGKKRNTSATPAQHLRNTSATPPQHLDAAVVDTVDEERNTSATPAQHLRNTSATPPQRRARSSLKQESDTRAQEQESGSPDLTDSSPPAEPSGSPDDLWSKAADLAEGGDPPLAEMETPADDGDSLDPASTSPAQPFDPIEEFTPLPPPSASPAARPRGLSDEGALEPVAPPQSAPSLFGRTDTAPEAQTPAKAPPRARKATAADKAADALAVYVAWRVYHPRAAEAPTPDATKLLGRLLIEAGGLDGAMLLMEWAHVGTCDRARQLRGEAPWPDGRRTVYTDLGSLSRHVASRLEMAHDWKDKSTDKDTGLKVLHVPETPRASFRGRDTTNAMNILADIARRDLERQHGL